MTYDDPFQLTRQPGESVPSSDLTGLGKRASYLFLCQGVPLNDAVIKVAGEQPGITSEQVKRVVEYANQHTFQELFEKQAGDKNIDFTIADPFEVLQRMNDSAAPPVVKTAAQEYFQPPVQVSHRETEYDLKLAQTFGLELPKTAAMEKTALEKTAGALSYLLADRKDAHLVQADLEKMASLDSIKQATSDEGAYPMAEPFGDLKRARWKLEKLSEEVNSACEVNQHHIKEAQTSFHYELRQHLLEGGGLGEIAHVLSGMSSPELTKAAMHDFEPELRKLAAVGRINLGQLRTDMIHYEMQKCAHRIANPDNVIVKAFSGYVKLAEDQQVLQLSRQKIDGMLKEARQLTAQAAAR